MKMVRIILRTFAKELHYQYLRGPIGRSEAGALAACRPRSVSSSVAAVGAAQVGRKSMVGSLAVRVLPSLRRQIHLPSQRHHRPPPDIAQPP